MKHKFFDKQTKLAVVHEIQAGKTTAQVCREYEIKPDMARRWRLEYKRDPVRAFSGQGHAVTAEGKVAELERTIGKLYLEIDFLKKLQEALQKRLAQAKKER